MIKITTVKVNVKNILVTFLYESNCADSSYVRKIIKNPTTFMFRISLNSNSIMIKIQYEVNLVYEIMGQKQRILHTHIHPTRKLQTVFRTTGNKPKTND